MLPSTPNVESVYLDSSNGILSGLMSLPRDVPSLPAPAVSSSSSHTLPASGPPQSPTEPMSSEPHTVLIDQTTLDPTAAMAVAARIHKETDGKAVMLDAPVSGGQCYRACAWGWFQHSRRRR